MDKESQEVFDKIVKLDPSSLSYEQIQFLNARRTYLTQEQRRVFASILVKEKAEK